MRHHICSRKALGAVVLLGAAACSNAGEGVDTAASATHSGSDRAVVYRDLTAYEFSVCWENDDGSIQFAGDGSLPLPNASIGSVRLYVPFDLDGTRLTDVETFTRCSLNE